MSTCVGGLLSSIAVVVLCWCSAGSLPSGLGAPVFFFLSLLLVGRGLPGWCAWVCCPFVGLLLLVCALFLRYILVSSIYFFLLGGLVLLLLFV